MDTFTAYRGRSVEEVLGILHTTPGAVLVAGGTDLIVKMKDGKVRPTAVIAIDGLDELRRIEEHGDYMWVGAGCTHSACISSREVAKCANLLSQASALVGSPQIRNRGTIGGNVVTSSPAGDTIPALMCLNAAMVVTDGSVQREIPADQFFLGPGKNAMSRGELLLGMKIPVDKPGTVSLMRKLGQRKAMTISTASAAVHARLEDGVLHDVAIALGSVAPKVVRARNLEAALEGQMATPELLAEACALAKEDVSPISDIRASREYRLAMVEALSYQALFAAIWPERVDDPKRFWVKQRIGLDLAGGPILDPVEAAAVIYGKGSLEYYHSMEGHDRGHCRAGEKGIQMGGTSIGNVRTSCHGKTASGEPENEAIVEAASGVGSCRVDACAARGGVIRVEVELFGELASIAEGGRMEVELPSGARVADLIENLEIQDSSYIVALVNMKRAFEDTVLADRDHVSLMHPVGGGM